MDSDITHMTHPTCDTEFKKLRAAVRLHKINKNDDMLYAALPEGPPYVEPVKEDSLDPVIFASISESFLLNDKRKDKS